MHTLVPCAEEPGRMRVDAGEVEGKVRPRIETESDVVAVLAQTRDAVLDADVLDRVRGDAGRVCGGGFS